MTAVTQTQTTRETAKVADPKLAESGRLQDRMGREPHAGPDGAPRAATRRRSRSRAPRIAGCLHVTKETAVLVRTLRAAGAEV